MERHEWSKEWTINPQQQQHIVQSAIFQCNALADMFDMYALYLYLLNVIRKVYVQQYISMFLFRYLDCSTSQGMCTWLSFFMFCYGSYRVDFIKTVKVWITCTGQYFHCLCVNQYIINFGHISWDIIYFGVAMHRNVNSAFCFPTEIRLMLHLTCHTYILHRHSRDRLYDGFISSKLKYSDMALD